MFLDLVGVYQDGSEQDPRVPKNARQAIAIIQGATVVLRIRVVTSAGVPVDLLGGGWSLIWTAKKVNNGQGFKRLGSPSILDGVGSASFLLTAEETAKLKRGKYAYDIFMVGPGGIQEPVVPYSEMVVEPSKYTDDSFPLTPSPTLPIIVPSAQRLYLPGFDTSVVSSGRMVYATANYLVGHTDAAALPGAHCLGHYDGTEGQVLALGIVSGLFSDASPTPAPNGQVYLARADDESGGTAAGKLTAVPPASGFVAFVGSVVSVDADFGATRRADVLVRVQPFVKKAA